MFDVHPRPVATLPPAEVRSARVALASRRVGRPEARLGGLCDTPPPRGNDCGAVVAILKTNIVARIDPAPKLAGSL